MTTVLQPETVANLDKLIAADWSRNGPHAHIAQALKEIGEALGARNRLLRFAVLATANAAQEGEQQKYWKDRADKAWAEYEATIVPAQVR